MANWIWENTSTDRSGSSGDLAKLFRNEEVKQPGLLAVGAPTVDATIVAREVIQNSWDAATEFQRARRTQGLQVPDFAIRFKFSEATGKNKVNLVERLDLNGLAMRAYEVGDPTRLGIVNSRVLDSLKSKKPLRLLEIHESGTTGMYGPFSSPTSKMYLALLSVGYTKKDIGAGGSYGYGKAGLIRASALHSVVAYSRFEPREPEVEVTRRALGVTYWGQHECFNEVYTGFARLGSEGGGSVTPFSNDEADELANDLGLEIRGASDGEMGTTFLLLEPTVNPKDLVRAVERNWWPALKDSLFSVEVEDYDGSVLHPKPRQNKELASFIRAYEIAMTSQDNVVENEKRITFNRFTSNDGESREVGVLGLVADTSTWSYDDEVAGLDGDAARRHRSLVALIRGPRMVVEYFDVTGEKPHVRGAFVADEGIDDLLRQTEPKAHDAWLSDAADVDVYPIATEVAKQVIGRVRSKTMEWRRLLKPKLDRSGATRLRELDRLVKKLLSGTRVTPPPPSNPRVIALSLRQRLVEIDESHQLIGLEAEVAVNLNENFDFSDTESTQVEVRFQYLILEDGSSGEAVEIKVSAPGKFTDLGVRGAARVFRGELGRAEKIFEVKSAAYSSDWTGKLVVSAVVVQTQVAAAEIRGDE